MIYFSKPTKKTLVWISVLCLLLILTFSVFASLDLFGLPIWRAAAVLFVFLLIALCYRYLVTGYQYILDPPEELLSLNRLTVLRVLGRQKQQCLTVSLGDLRQIVPYCRRRAFVKRYQKPKEYLSMTPDIFPRRSYLLLFGEREELRVLRIQCDESFASEIAARAGVGVEKGIF